MNQITKKSAVALAVAAMAFNGYAVIIGGFDWDSTSPANQADGIGGGASVTKSTAGVGVGGSNGLQVTTVGWDNGWWQVYLGYGDFATAGVTAGNLTLTDVQNLRITMDVKTSSNFNYGWDLASDSPWLVANDCTNGIVNAGTDWQTVTFDLSVAPAATLQTWVNSMNAASGGQTDFRFRLDIHGGTGDQTIAIDNVAMNVIPEPATMGLFGLFGLGVVIARRFRM